MIDARQLYMKQLIGHYSRNVFDGPTQGFTINYRYPEDKENRYIIFSHNEGLDAIIQYIDELEHKVDKLQYIQRIIDVAKENKNDRCTML